MADKQTTIIEKSEDQPPSPPSDRTLDMAVEFGQLRAEYQATARELAEVKAGQSQAMDLIRNQNELIQSLRSQTEVIGLREEQLSQSQTAITSAVTDALEDKSETGVLEITPPMETKIEIEQKPAMSRNWIQSVIFGRNR